VKASRLSKSETEHGESRCNVTPTGLLEPPRAAKTGVNLSKTKKLQDTHMRSPLCTIIDICSRKLFLRQQELKQLTDEGPVVGSIWSTYPEKEEDLFGPLVLVLETPAAERETLLVTEVTQDYMQCKDGDIQLPHQTSGLHFSCIVRVAVVFSIQPQALRKCAGKLSKHETLRVVRQIRRRTQNR
jgi:hypothetical protein